MAVVAAVYGFAVVLSRLRTVATTPFRLPLAAIGAVPWGWYAVRIVQIARSGGEPLDETTTLDHWPVMAALGIAPAVLTFRGTRLHSFTAGAAAAGFGLLGLVYPDQPASPGSAWGIVALIWGLAVMLTACLGTARGSDARMGLLEKDCFDLG